MGQEQAKYTIEDESEEPEEELWLVSYADMMTLLFGFFVILYSFSTVDDKKFAQMTEKMAEAFKSKSETKADETDSGISDEARQIRALQMLVSMLNLGDNMNEAVNKIEKSFTEGKTGENAKSILVEKVSKRNKKLIGSVEKSTSDEFQTVELVLPATTLFPAGGHQLSKGASLQLRSLADDLRHVADLSEIEVVGHTDSQPPPRGATYDSNFSLSALRAGSVAAALIRFGVDRNQIIVRGMGDLKPLVPEYTDDGRPNRNSMARNRRVGIVLKVRRVHAPLAH